MTPQESGASTARAEDSRTETAVTRRKRGYVAQGECRQKRSCYLMGCSNDVCRAAHTLWVKQNRLLRLTRGWFLHGPAGYDIGCRCPSCRGGRVYRYRREVLAHVGQIEAERAA